MDRARLRGVFERRFVGLGVLAADLDDGRAVRAQPRDLDRGSGRRDEHRRGHADRGRDVCVGQSGVPARGDHDPHPLVELSGLARRQHPVERPTRLERPGVLEQLELEPDGPGVDLDDGGHPHVRGDPRRGVVHVGARDHRPIIPRRRLPDHAAVALGAGARADPGAQRPVVDVDSEPLTQVNRLPAREFFSLAAELLSLHPPHLTDWSILARIARTGLRPGEPFDLDALDPVVRAALEDGPAAAIGVMRSAVPRMGRAVDGWQMFTDSMGVYGNYYVRRAVVAMVGLGADPPEDAIYPLNIADADGQPLDGDHDYVLHFDPDRLPPVDAFWSVTMYDAEGFQAANPDQPLRDRRPRRRELQPRRLARSLPATRPSRPRPRG